MNTYQVEVQASSQNVPRKYHVDSCRPGAAISAALNGIDTNQKSMSVKCYLFAEDVDRHYSDPKVRAV